MKPEELEKIRKISQSIYQMVKSNERVLAINWPLGVGLYQADDGQFHALITLHTNVGSTQLEALTFLENHIQQLISSASKT